MPSQPNLFVSTYTCTVVIKVSSHVTLHMNPLHAGNKTHKQRIQLGPETQGTFYQKSGGIRGFRKMTKIICFIWKSLTKNLL